MHDRKKISLNDIIVGNFPNYPTGKLKKRLVKEGILEYKCVLCGNNGTHNGLPLTLQLDHINGVNNDHRLDNLRLLCPNCHTQQDTYAGKNKPKKEKIVTPTFLEIKLEKDKQKWKSLKDSPEIKFGVWGWRVRLSKKIGVTPQNIDKWLMRVDPKFLKEVKNM
jgi:5-methylcytosine-specific restriction endonuclease McrA